jgi:regulatory factor X, other
MGSPPGSIPSLVSANHHFNPSLHGHSRSSSTSSSAHSRHSSFSPNRPASSHGAFRQSPVISQDDLYRHTHGFTFPPAAANQVPSPFRTHSHPALTHSRHSSTNSTHSNYSFPTTLTTPNDSPPSLSQQAATTDPSGIPLGALKASGTTNIRRLRTGMSPYPRDQSGSESVRSSSSEAEDYQNIFIGHHHHHPQHPQQQQQHHQHMHMQQQQHDYSNMYMGGHGMHPGMAHETVNAAGAFGRMTLDPEHALEQLAANVRTATTTSASDRAKQIFVQAWCDLHPPRLAPAVLTCLFRPG